MLLRRLLSKQYLLVRLAVACSHPSTLSALVVLLLVSVLPVRVTAALAAVVLALHGGIHAHEWFRVREEETAVEWRHGQ